MNLTINGIPIIVDPIAAQEIVRKHLLNGEADIPMIAVTGQLSAPQLKRGEKLIGFYAGPDGRNTCSILLPGENRKVDFDDAGKWIADQGGVRPNRMDGLLLYLHHRALFEKDDVLWLEELADDSSYAWGQFFNYGTQYYWLKDLKLLARAVRRVTI